MVIEFPEKDLENEVTSPSEGKRIQRASEEENFQVNSPIGSGNTSK